MSKPIPCPSCGAAMTHVEECSICHFKPGEIACFADTEALQVWKTVYVPPRPSAEKLLIPRTQKLAVLDPRTHTLTLYNQFERERVLTDVRQFSMSDSHWAAVFMDGHAEAAGDNSFQQCAVDGLTDVTYVHAMANATCLIAGGRVTVRGYCPFEKALTGWTDVVQLTSGTEHIAGLRRDGTVLLASTPAAPEGLQGTAPAAWRNVIAIEAGETYLLGLTKEGRVLSLGTVNGQPLTLDWTEQIVSIAAARDYALGLTASGTLLVTGKARSRFGAKLDQDTHGWSRLTAIGADDSVAAGVDSSGRLLLAGKPAYRSLPDAPYWDAKQLP